MESLTLIDKGDQLAAAQDKLLEGWEEAIPL